MKDRFASHPKNPDILVGKTYRFTDKKGVYQKPYWVTTHELVNKLTIQCP